MVYQTERLMSDKDGDPADYTADLSPTEPSRMPAANAVQPSTDHATTSFGDAANHLMREPKKSHKDTGAMREPVDGDEEVLVANDGAVHAEVRTQETAARTYNAFTVNLNPASTTPGSIYPGDPVMLVGDDPSRQKVVITNASEVAILLGPLNVISSGAGFTLPAGQKHDPEVQGAIYACIPSGGVASALVGVWVERNL